MDTIMLELRNAVDDRSSKACGAWIEVHQGCAAGRRTEFYFFAGRHLKTIETPCPASARDLLRLELV